VTLVEPHLDETGQPCTRHAAISIDTLLAYAAIGSRASGFHHDTASKLQSLMMAVDEIGESANDELKGAAATAAAAIRDLHALLTVNRALAKPPQRKKTPLSELLTRAAERNGVRLIGDTPAVAVHVALPSIAHALAMLLDLAAGPIQGTRSVSLSVATGPRIRIQITASNGFATLPNANEQISLAAFLMKREDGTLACQPNGFVVELPAAE
jgi:hypothetical protein